MKLNFTKICIAGTLLCMMNMQTAQAETPARNTGTEKPELLKPFKKSKTKVSRNRQVVRIYPDPIRRTIHVVAKEKTALEIDFFVFDLQGTLVEHFKLASGDHEKLTELDRGTYIYRVFAGDEEAASGNFEVR